MKKLKIAFLSYRSKPFSGGQGIYVKYLSKALHDLGHEIDVFSGPPYPDLDSKTECYNSFFGLRQQAPGWHTGSEGNAGNLARMGEEKKVKRF